MTRLRCRNASFVGLACALWTCLAFAPAQTLPRDFTFEIPRRAEVTLTMTASCRGCDWSAPGREAVALRLTLDGRYSQHVLLTRGEEPAEYSVLLGPLSEGRHVLTVARDATYSAKDAGSVDISSLKTESTDLESPDHPWLAAAPVLHARPGTVERFTDVPLAAYVEALPDDAGYRYTIIFSHEDGGTPTDRLMATWGRSTDIEFVYEREQTSTGVSQVYQGKDHAILPFKGQYLGTHPLLWVSTDNNMVSDTGPPDAIRFAPAPQRVNLTDVSREVFMDANPWLYAVMTAELAREGRIRADAPAGSGRIPHPRQFAYIEACGELRDATLAFEIGVRSGGEMSWHATDRGDPRFRIARSGCFRAAVPVPEGTRPSHLRAVRVRAHTRPARRGETPLPPGSGAATLRRLNAVFMLDEGFTPRPSGAKWMGTLAVPVDAATIEIPVR